MKFRNVSPLGDLSLPAHGLAVEAGKEIEATGDLAKSLLAQAEHFLRIDKPLKSTRTTKPAKEIKP